MAWRQALSQVWASPGVDPPLNQLSETLPWGGRGAKEPVRHAHPFFPSCVHSFLGLAVAEPSVCGNYLFNQTYPAPENTPVRGQCSLATTIGERAIIGAHASQFVRRLDACEAVSAQVGQGRAIQLAMF